MKNFLPLLCGLLLVAELTWFRVQRRELESLQQTEATVSEVKGVETKLKLAEADLKAAQARVKKDREQSMGNRGMRMLTAVEFSAFQKKKAVEDSPEFLRLKALRQKYSIQSRYYPLFDKLGLDEAGRNNLLQLLNNKENFRDDFNAAMAGRQTGVFDAMKASDPARAVEVSRSEMNFMKSAIQTAKDELEASFSSALGAEGYNVYRDFEKHLTQHLAVIELQQSVAGTDAALSLAQFDALRQIFTQTEPTKLSAPNFFVPMPPREQGQYSAGGQRYLGVGYSPCYTDAFGNLYATYLPQETDLSRAEAVLSQAQFAALQKLRETKQARIELARIFGL